MKTILAIALLVAMLAMPSVLAAPNVNPPANPNSPAGIAASGAVAFGDTPDGPGLSEIGKFIVNYIGENGPGFSNTPVLPYVAYYSPANKDEPPEPPEGPV